MINVVILNFGYVESTSLTSLICVNERHTFATDEEAIKDLAEDILAKYKHCFDSAFIPSSPCCLVAKEDGQNNYCSQCGTYLKSKFDIWKFQSWLLDLRSYDLDSFGYDEECGDREMTWVIGERPDCLLGRPREHVINVERAERTILEVLDLTDE